MKFIIVFVISLYIYKAKCRKITHAEFNEIGEVQRGKILFALFTILAGKIKKFIESSNNEIVYKIVYLILVKIVHLVSRMAQRYRMKLMIQSEMFVSH